MLKLQIYFKYLDKEAGEVIISAKSKFQRQKQIAGTSAVSQKQKVKEIARDVKESKCPHKNQR